MSNFRALGDYPNIPGARLCRQQRTIGSAGQWTVLGPELVTDGDMELAGTANWSSSRGAILSKQTTTPFEGTRCLRVAYGLQTNYRCLQNLGLTVGQTYRFSVRARSDGFEVPYIADNPGDGFGVGTTSTSWQLLTADIVAASVYVWLGVVGHAPAGSYVEFDLCSVRLVG